MHAYFIANSFHMVKWHRMIDSNKNIAFHWLYATKAKLVMTLWLYNWFFNGANTSLTVRTLWCISILIAAKFHFMFTFSKFQQLRGIHKCIWSTVPIANESNDLHLFTNIVMQLIDIGSSRSRNDFRKLIIFNIVIFSVLLVKWKKKCRMRIQSRHEVHSQ